MDRKDFPGYGEGQEDLDLIPDEELKQYFIRQKLSNFIQDEIDKEFEKKYISKNLVNTITASMDGDDVIISIPAEIYDMAKFMEHGVIVYTGKGSYASAVDIEGGFSKKHKNFAERCVMTAIDKWLVYLGKEGKVSEEDVEQ